MVKLTTVRTYLNLLWLGIGSSQFATCFSPLSNSLACVKNKVVDHVFRTVKSSTCADIVDDTLQPWMSQDQEGGKVHERLTFLLIPGD